MRSSRRGALCAALALAALQTGLLAATAWDKSDTADETRYLAAAGALWAQGDFRYLCEAPVLPKWGFGLALRLAGADIANTPPGWDEAMRHMVTAKAGPALRRTLFAARAATIAVVVLGGLLLWSAARRRGDEAALVTHALWCLSPTVLANGALATLDAWAAALVCAVLWAAVRLVERPSSARTIVLGGACGAAAATKATVLGAVAIVAAGALVTLSWRRAAPPRDGRMPERAADPRIGSARAADSMVADARADEPKVDAASPAAGEPRARLALVGVVALGTLWALYGFTRGHVDLANPCPLGTTMAASVPGPWPFPAWIEGVAFQLHHGREGHLGYLFGEVRSTGWWWFYLACLALKLTIAAQVLLVVRAGALLARPARGRRWGDLALLAYPGLLLVAMSAARHQANVSFLLPAFPFAMLWVGWGMGDVRRTLGRVGRPLVLGLLVLGAVETLRVHPHYLMFFNAWAGGPEGGPRYLVHREDWGQDDRRLGEWQRQNAIPRLFYTAYGPNPASWGIVFDPVPCAPTPGVYALHAVEVHRPQFGLRPGCIDWLTVEPPDERIGYSIYIYRVDAGRLARLAAARDTAAPFWRSGPGRR